jgi:predicted metal-dependent peptidase
MSNKQAAELITKAVTAIVLDDPFYGYLLLRQEIEQSDEIEVAATNGKRIIYNPEKIRKMTPAEIKGLLKHEVMHIAHMHHLRRQNRDPNKWNQAADLVINAILIESGVTLPEGGLVDPQYKDYSTEHAYNMLPYAPQSASGGQSWNWGEVQDAPGLENETTRQQLEEDCKVELIQAANTAKMMGKLPAYIDRLVNQIRESKMPWRQILARFFRATAKADYSWLRPNRRFLASGIYLPSLYSEALGPVVIAVDTSGSVAGPELEQFFGCINGILRQTKPEAVHVLYCDAHVNNVQVFKSSDYPIKPERFKPVGGGGTDFVPVFEYVKKNRLNPVALLYLTDMYGRFPDKAPGYPTIWCATSEVKAPFGKTLEIT